MTATGQNAYSLAAIAEHLDGELLGDGERLINGVASLEHAAEDRLSFLVSDRNLPADYARSPGVLLLRPEHADLFDGNRITVADPYLAYARVSELFALKPAGAPAIHPDAMVSGDVSIGEGVRIGAGSVVGDAVSLGDNVTIGCNVVIEDACIIGEGSTIESTVTLCRGTRVGRRCVLSPGVVIGASGFGYAPEGRGWRKIHQLGGVVIGDDVDIGANTTIDRGAIDDTVIGDRVKLDNQIQIAHNVRIGDDTIAAGCLAVAGSTRIGQRCRIGGRVSILGHLQIADDVVLTAGAFVARSIPEPGTWSSLIPAQPAPRWRRIVATLTRKHRDR